MARVQGVQLEKKRTGTAEENFRQCVYRKASALGTGLVCLYSYMTQEKRFFGAICRGLLGLSKAKMYTVICTVTYG